MERGGVVYIITKFTHSTLYPGVTSDLIFRTIQHREKLHPDSFTAHYNITKLVYYFFYPTIEEAIAEEKRIKDGSRIKKLKLIKSINPEWKDLWEEIKEW